VVLRLLNLENVVRPLEQLGMPDTVYQPFKRLLEETNGAIWVTGPTGSGKTTTLYAALQELDSLHRNILTIEDPIEYQMSNIGQMAVKPKIGLTFARGLRHILRQDPDVILVGETRDLETAEIAIRAALTGHLVFSTLHTNDAAGAVIRLVDMGVPAYLTAAATRGAMAQRLVRVLCPACRKPAMLTPQQKKLLGPHADRFPDDTAWVPVGCPECRGGYRGRVGIYELLVLNDQLRDRIRGRAHGGDVRKHARTLGFKSMLFDGLEKARRGETSLEEVLKAVGQSPVEAA
jgi:general secretion pathway protein E